MKALDTVRRLAGEVRWYFEAHRADSDGPGSSPFLGGKCVEASYALFRLLRHAGLKAKIAGNESHWWVEVEDHIVDVTATQFSDVPGWEAVTPVYVVPLNKVGDHALYCEDVYRFSSTRAWRTNLEYITASYWRSCGDIATRLIEKGKEKKWF